MNKYITIVEKLVAMFIIAVGLPICGEFFIYEPKLPKTIGEGIKFNGCCPTNAKLVIISVDNNLKVKCWFLGTYNGVDNVPFDFSLEELETYQPTLYACIITHVFDMIENVKES